MNNLTKIVATIGPATESDEMIHALIREGVNVFRFNLKHNESSWHKAHIQRVKEIAKNLDVPVGVLIDLKGPEIRTILQNDISVTSGDRIQFSKFSNSGSSFTVTNPEIIDDIQTGQTIIADDGKLEFEVVEKSKDSLILESRVSGTLKHRKTLNIPGFNIKIPAISEEDRHMISDLSDEEIDYIALSFVRTAEDIYELQRLLAQHNMSAHIISKIETAIALENLDEIIDSSDGIMIARGDLGVELPFEKVPYYQKKIIRRCLERGIPVITATQMLHSMIVSPRPTRAEVSDVANAVYDFTSAVMLSEESAMGEYPQKSVEALRKIITFTEKRDLVEDHRAIFAYNANGTGEMLCESAYDLHLQMLKKEYPFGGFIVFSQTGRTARMLSRYRPIAPIFVFAPTKKVRDNLVLNFGIYPFVQPTVYAKNKIIRLEDMRSAQLFLEQKKLFDGSKYYIMLYGNNWNVEGRVSTIRVVFPSE